MCLAVPMQIMSVHGAVARCTANGIERDVSLYLLAPDSTAPGDFVIVHVGYAIQKVAAEDALATWGLLDAMSGQDGQDA